MVYRSSESCLSPRLFLTTAIALASFATSCGTAPGLPGTSLGTYNVSGALVTNTCGASLGLPSPWTFTAQMSEVGTSIYWQISGGSMVSGTMSSATQVNITAIDTSNVDTSEAGVEGPCDLTSSTAMNLVLSAGSPPTSFTGAVGYTFTAATGVSSTTDCTDQLSAYGGPYDTLPCTASYSLTGMRQ
jgi:hypothetical protein